MKKIWALGFDFKRKSFDEALFRSFNEVAEDDSECFQAWAIVHEGFAFWFRNRDMNEVDHKSAGHFDSYHHIYLFYVLVSFCTLG